MFTFYHRHWTNKSFPWFKELVLQNTKNSSHSLSRFTGTEGNGEALTENNNVVKYFLVKRNKTTVPAGRQVFNQRSIFTFTFHPQRWTNKPVSWVKELVLQNVKNTVKYFMVKRNKGKDKSKK